MTTGWKQNVSTPHATTLGLEKQVLKQCGASEKIESDSGTRVQNNLTDTWAKKHGVGWVYHIP